MDPYNGPQLGSNLPQLFQQHRGKSISSSLTPDRSFTVDSGYLTTASSTPNLSTSSASFSSLSCISTPQRVVNTSSNLDPISENAETVDKTKLTPVTENIRNICNFHITTPKEEDQCMRGSKRPATQILDFSNFESTPKKSRIHEHDYSMQRKFVDTSFQSATTPRKSARNRSKTESFRRKLKSASDLEPYFNDIENEQSPRRTIATIVSPKYTRSASRTPLSSSSSNLQSIGTPKLGNFQDGVSIDAKSSVKKLLKFTDSQFEQLIRSESKELQTTTTSTTKCSSNTKKYLAKCLPADNSGAKIVPEIISKPSSKTFCDIDLEVQSATSRNRSRTDPAMVVLRDRELSRREFDDRARLKPADLFSARNKTDSESQELQEILKSGQDCSQMEISLAPDVSNLSANMEMEFRPGSSDVLPVRENTPPLPNYTIKSSSDLHLDESIQCESLSTMLNSNFNVPLPRTPKKSKTKSFDHERLGIIYPVIPRTPSKQSRILANRRQSAVTRRRRAVTFKRKYYGEVTHLNIISKLNSYGHILEMIFNYLTSKDLANMCEVSRSWRQAVQSSRSAWDRVDEYLRARQCQIENELQPVVVPSSSLSRCKDGPYRKIPFNQNNFRIDRKRSIEDNRSPPVSPSKRKFHDNQKIVRTLAPNEKLIKCPRCNKSSRIYNATTFSQCNQSKAGRRPTARGANKSSHIRSLSETFHSYTTPVLDMANRSEAAVQGSTPANVMSPRRSGTMSRIPRVAKSLSFDLPLFPPSPLQKPNDAATPSLSQYAECSGLSCRYRFCLECLCDYHPGSKCSLYTPDSPTKDDSANNDRFGSSSNAKTRRRSSLKRLCF